MFVQHSINVTLYDSAGDDAHLPPRTSRSRLPVSTSPSVKVVFGVGCSVSNTADLEHQGLDWSKHTHLDVDPGYLGSLPSATAPLPSCLMHIRENSDLLAVASICFFRVKVRFSSLSERILLSVSLCYLASEPNPAVAVMGWFQPSCLLSPPCHSAAKRSAASPTQWDLASRSNGG